MLILSFANIIIFLSMESLPDKECTDKRGIVLGVIPPNMAIPLPPL